MSARSFLSRPSTRCLFCATVVSCRSYNIILPCARSHQCRSHVASLLFAPSHHPTPSSYRYLVLACFLPSSVFRLLPVFPLFLSCTVALPSLDIFPLFLCFQLLVHGLV